MKALWVRTGTFAETFASVLKTAALARCPAPERHVHCPSPPLPTGERCWYMVSRKSDTCSRKPQTITLNSLLVPCIKPPKHWFCSRSYSCFNFPNCDSRCGSCSVSSFCDSHREKTYLIGVSTFLNIHSSHCSLGFFTTVCLFPCLCGDPCLCLHECQRWCKCFDNKHVRVSTFLSPLAACTAETWRSLAIRFRVPKWPKTRQKIFTCCRFV